LEVQQLIIITNGPRASLLTNQKLDVQIFGRLNVIVAVRHINASLLLILCSKTIAMYRNLNIIIEDHLL